MTVLPLQPAPFPSPPPPHRHGRDKRGGRGCARHLTVTSAASLPQRNSLDSQRPRPASHADWLGLSTASTAGSTLRGLEGQKEVCARYVGAPRRGLGESGVCGVGVTVREVLVLREVLGDQQGREREAAAAAKPSKSVGGGCLSASHKNYSRQS